MAQKTVRVRKSRTKDSATHEVTEKAFETVWKDHGYELVESTQADSGTGTGAASSGTDTGAGSSKKKG